MVLLAAARGLGQALRDLLEDGRGVLLGLGGQGGAVAGGVLAQVGHDHAEVADQRVEDAAQGPQVKGLAQQIQESNDVMKRVDGT